jgi:hypothetical protein
MPYLCRICVIIGGLVGLLGAFRPNPRTPADCQDPFGVRERLPEGLGIVHSGPR